MEKARSLSEAYDQICLLIRQSLTAGETATVLEDIVTFVIVCSAIALVLHLVAFCKKTLSVNSENIAPFLIVPIMAVGIISTLFFYETEGFIPCMSVMWIFGGIACGIGKGMGFMPDEDPYTEITEELRQEWKAEDARAHALEGQSVRFSDGTYGTIRGEDAESFMGKWALRGATLGGAMFLFAFIIGPLVWLYCIARGFVEGCIFFNPNTK